MVVCSVKAEFKRWCVVLKTEFKRWCVVLKAAFQWWCVVLKAAFKWCTTHHHLNATFMVGSAESRV